MITQAEKTIFGAVVLVLVVPLTLAAIRYEQNMLKRVDRDVNVATEVALDKLLHNQTLEGCEAYTNTISKIRYRNNIEQELLRAESKGVYIYPNTKARIQSMKSAEQFCKQFEN